MNTCKILMPIGNLGIGLNRQEVEEAMKQKPDAIAVDAGSTDSGPAYLANGMNKYQKQMIRHDMEICIVAARKANIPFLMGSCGTCGVDDMVDLCYELALDILKEHNLQGKIARIYASQNAEVLKRKYREGKIHPLEGAPEISEATFDQCSNIVALCGAEPFIEALKNGANIILCGRATDTAIMAALPIMQGCDVASAWHGAKVVECGNLCTDSRKGTGVFLTVDENGFAVTPTHAEAHCTPYTVSAHLLYENVNPFRLKEPSGLIVTDKCEYTQVDDRTVYVTGTRFEPAEQYTMKLEGACLCGYQSINLVGMADPKVMANPQKWIDNVKMLVDPLIEAAGYKKGSYTYEFKAYGYNAVIPGPVPERTPAPREIGMLLTVTADTQDEATQISKIFNPYLLHCPVDMTAQLPSFAFPFSPVDCARGGTYEFMFHHVVDVDSPLELVRIDYTDYKSDNSTGGC